MWKALTYYWVEFIERSLERLVPSKVSRLAEFGDDLLRPLLGKMLLRVPREHEEYPPDLLALYGLEDSPEEPSNGEPDERVGSEGTRR